MDLEGLPQPANVKIAKHSMIDRQILHYLIYWFQTGAKGWVDREERGWKVSRGAARGKNFTNGGNTWEGTRPVRSAVARCMAGWGAARTGEPFRKHACEASYILEFVKSSKNAWKACGMDSALHALAEEGKAQCDILHGRRGWDGGWSFAGHQENIS